ncbi:hypothetical protein TNCV_909481 [Trichonephila clavipes]|nr:hypothetical protein TNCV_909481 [Trichonephila clavipes]
MDHSTLSLSCVGLWWYFEDMGADIHSHVRHLTLSCVLLCPSMECDQCGPVVLPPLMCFRNVSTLSNATGMNTVSPIRSRGTTGLEYYRLTIIVYLNHAEFIDGLTFE